MVARCSEAGRRWRSGKERDKERARERMVSVPLSTDGDSPPPPSSRGSGIFNYSLGEIVERGKQGEENNAAGAPSRAVSVRGARTPLCLPRTSNCFGLVQTLPLPEIAYLCMQLAPMQPVAPVCSPFYRRNQAPSKSESLK